MKIFNEIWISLVLWKWNWIGISCEEEYENGSEERFFTWKKIEFSQIRDIYFRFWFWKYCFILSTKDSIKYQKKNKYALKIIFGFSN